MKPIAILGGAFDPVHLGHLEVAQKIEAHGFEVIFMPCGDRHQFEKQMLPAEERIEMLQLVIGGRQICRIEIENKTYRAADTYPLLKARYGRVYWIIGSDNANCLHRWHESERLKKEIPFLVLDRKGHPLSAEGEWCRQEPHRYIDSSTELEGSSTLARAAIAQNDWQKASLLVPSEVLRLIRARSWYASPKSPHPA